MPMLRLLLALVCAIPTAGLIALDDPGYEPSGRDTKLLAAALAASQVYQRNVNILVRLLDNAETRMPAMRSIADLHDPLLAEHLIPYLDWDIHNTVTVANACHALVELGAVQITDQLRVFTEKELEAGTHREAVRLASLNALAQLEQVGKPDYTRETDTVNGNTRATGITGLGTIEDGEAGKILAKPRCSMIGGTSAAWPLSASASSATTAMAMIWSSPSPTRTSWCAVTPPRPGSTRLQEGDSLHPDRHGCEPRWR